MPVRGGTGQAHPPGAQQTTLRMSWDTMACVFYVPQNHDAQMILPLPGQGGCTLHLRDYLQSQNEYHTKIIKVFGEAFSKKLQKTPPFSIERQHPKTFIFYR
ncbi:hypothetical protein [Novacetimonas hansenii]|uniref:hypothetical protein n=1 Tax=Novacetimonas hansenii TaxID=436 RepID=UPI000A77EDA5|nr:hypothetical protein [Novacetimonas hansenii]